MTKLAGIVGLVAAAADVAAPASADDHAPSTLRMRARRTADGAPGDPDGTEPSSAPAPPGDDERAAPAKDAGKPEVISVTGTTSARELITGRAPVSIVPIAGHELAQLVELDLGARAPPEPVRLAPDLQGRRAVPHRPRHRRARHLLDRVSRADRVRPRRRQDRARRVRRGSV